MPTTDIPFSTIAMDHVTMPALDSVRYILNVMDFATRYVIPAAVKSTAASEVINHLHHVFYTFGTPIHCISDHGSAFPSIQFKRFMHLHGIELHYATVYRPEGNCLVERSNGTLVSTLRKLCAIESSTWESKLQQEAAFAVNTTVNSSTGFAPFALLFGYIPKIPLQQHRPVQQPSLMERILDLSSHPTKQSSF
ncbi:uncharacterized protein LOC135373365 [Ornithodoros turicata]|uniref:uncharacterized protein LOC135373365 n=1 Tax=Ornithodoros turicata TaxID=34597 RepID=UPI0031396A84